ncbi:lipoyl(octanoyl) transferase LipB [Persephonella sp.]
MKIIDLGLTEYQQALRLQKRIFSEKIRDSSVEDTVLITEHFPVYTTGKTTSQEHIREIPPDIPVYSIERGGSVTFHGRGQIVVYPIIHLQGKKLSVKNFVWTLEEIMIETLGELGINGYRNEKYRGVFTDRGKVGFVGVKISRFVSYHGMSLNVDVDKSFFSRIIPCGIQDIPVANISDFIPGVTPQQVKPILIEKIKKFL